jgi:translation initiation factor 1A
LLPSFRFFTSLIIRQYIFKLHYFLYIYKEGLDLGKRKVLNEAALKELVMPHEGEMFGRVIKLVGGDNVIVKCNDGIVRTCRIRGKIKRRMWIRENDLVLLAPWDFQSDKADIIWRYIAAHADKLEQEGHLKGLNK